MAVIDLNTLLELVGTLNDSSDTGSASERFRNYLQNNVIKWDKAREYIEEALKRSGDQYNKALQDLINHLGHLLGFEVTYGRYRGVKGQVGFDGFWRSPSGWSMVVETKTTDVYTVRTDTLLGYINSLVSDGRVNSTNSAIGLYVYGRFDSHTNQLENAIAIENRRNQLRVVSVPALLDLLELKQEYGLAHDSILGLLLPAPIRIDPIVDLIRRVVAQEQEKDSFISPFADDTVMSASVLTENVPVPGPSNQSPKHIEGMRINKASNQGFTGKTVKAVIFRRDRTEVSKWREAFEVVVNSLVHHDRKQFIEVAPTLVGKKRPYFTVNPEELRQPGSIPGTNLYFETNLSAEYLAKVAWELVSRMGFSREDLEFEVD